MKCTVFELLSSIVFSGYVIKDKVFFEIYRFIYNRSVVKRYDNMKNYIIYYYEL